MAHKKTTKTTPVKPSVTEADETTLVLDRVTQAVRPPPLQQVVMRNDDFTPMDFVVEILQQFFNKNTAEAIQIMRKIHYDGRGICGIYTKDIATTKVNLVMDAAAQQGHPLQCFNEPVE